jgi:hypothetical protein
MVFSPRLLSGFLSIAVLALSFFLSPDMGAGEASPDVPMPYARGGSDGNFSDSEALHSLNSRHNARSLPDVTDMLASSAFQEGFLYGGKYRLPFPGDSLSYRHYREEEKGSISVSDSRVLLFDKAWFDEVLNRELGSGVGLLFAALGGPGEITEVSRLPGIEETPLNSIQITLYIIAVMAMLISTLSPDRRDKPARSIYKPIITARRRAKAA